MPYFNYDGDIEIDPDEYLDSCSKAQVEELIQCLIDDEYLPPSVIKGKYIGVETQSIPEIKFGEIISKIVSNRLQLTNEEDELLKKIASRF
jgi:hypothetical protein